MKVEKARRERKAKSRRLELNENRYRNRLQDGQWRGEELIEYKGRRCEGFQREREREREREKRKIKSLDGVARAAESRERLERKHHGSKSDKGAGRGRWRNEAMRTEIR